MPTYNDTSLLVKEATKILKGAQAITSRIDPLSTVLKGYLISADDMKTLSHHIGALASNPLQVYVTVSAYDQFAQDITIDFDRMKTINDAKAQARRDGWAVEEEEEWPNNGASPGHSALLYHVQEEAQTCEDYISIFEVCLDDIFKIPDGEDVKDTFGFDPDARAEDGNSV